MSAFTCWLVTGGSSPGRQPPAQGWQKHDGRQLGMAALLNFTPPDAVEIAESTFTDHRDSTRPTDETVVRHLARAECRNPAASAARCRRRHPPAPATSRPAGDVVEVLLRLRHLQGGEHQMADLAVAQAGAPMAISAWLATKAP